MDKILPFKIFCIENYKILRNLTGKAAFDVFQRHQVFEYITDYYDILHSYGTLYLVNNLDEFIKHREDSSM